MKSKLRKRLDISFVVFTLLLCVLIWHIPTGFENSAYGAANEKVRGRVLSVDNKDLKHVGFILTGTQDLAIEILNGHFRGDTVRAVNVCTGQMSFDKVFEEGDKVFTLLQTDKNAEKILSARADDIYRLNVELVLFLIFALFLFCFAGWTGAKALLSFLFTALTIWKLLIPFFLKGYDPVWISVLMTSLCTVVIILLIGGFTRKSMVALSGSVSGVVVTALLATIFGYYFQIPGTVREFAEPLMYNGFFDLDFSKIFIAGIFISAAGAVMDVAMDIAASQEEIALRHPGLPARELVLSGFRISRAVIGTMTTTLLFAYSGSYTFVLMLLMAKGMPMINIFNTNYIASEIFQTLVGSFGLVLVAPLTSLIGAFVYSKTINTKISQS